MMRAGVADFVGEERVQVDPRGPGFAPPVLCEILRTNPPG